MIKDLKKTQLSTDELTRLQDNIAEFARQFVDPFFSGIIIPDVVIGTGLTNIAHGLARKYNGWQLVDIKGDARVWRDDSSAADKNKFISLRASASVTVSLRVF